MATDTETKRGVRRDMEDQRTRRDRHWNVILWNDHVNAATYVVFVLQRTFGYSRDKANKLMLEAHNGGKTAVATEDRERAEMHAAQLHGFGLQATVAQ